MTAVAGRGNRLADAARIRELWQQGLTQAAIAQAVGVNPATVWRHTRDLRAAKTAVNRERIRELWQQGLPVAAITKQLGVSERAVATHTRDLKRRPCKSPLRHDWSSAAPRLTPEMREAIRNARLAGSTLQQLSREYGFTAGYLSEVCRDLPCGRRSVAQQYTTVSDAAAELGISRYTVYEYLKTGRLEGVQVGERHPVWLVARSSVAQRKARRINDSDHD